MPDDVTAEAEPTYGPKQTRKLGGIKRHEEAINAMDTYMGGGNPRRRRQLQQQVNRARRRFGLVGADSGARSGEDLDIVDVNSMEGLMRSNKNRGQGRNRSSVFAKRVEQGFANQRQQESQAYLDETVQPQIDLINERARQLLEEPAIRASEEAAMKSQAVELIRRQETDRQKRLQGLFGAKGYSAGSPIAQVLANRSAMEADAEIAKMFRDYDIELARQRQNESMTELGLVSNLNAQGLAARQAATSGDFDRLLGIQSELGGLFEAIQQQQEAMDLESALARDADKKSGFDYAMQGLNVINGLGKATSSVMTGGTAAGLF